MKINGGRYKNHVIKVPKCFVKPTKDIVKIALFNIIGQDLTNKSLIDLFAGSGAVGIEALSRGANNILLVDNQFICVHSIINNLKNLNSSAKVIKQDVFKLIKKSKFSAFDFIFADPPYCLNNYNYFLNLLSKSSLVKEDSLIIIEKLKKKSFTIQSKIFKLIDQRNYGETELLFFRF